jgi:hypothetical protein
MTKEDLLAKYKEAFGTLPPSRMGLEFATNNLRYHEQCQQYGGLRPSTIRQLVALAEGKTALKEGTKLIRSWRGTTHEVAVTVDGTFIYQNQPYRSLTAIARHITGTPWNGRAFFGVTKALQHG